VMQYFPNKSLADLLQSNLKLDWNLRWRMSLEAARAMNYLHQKAPPIFHRDIKCQNLLVNSDFHIFVSDFGLAKIQSSDASTRVSGTTQWMAPELLDSHRVVFTSKCDVFSFGVTLWEIATRKKPYEKVSQAMISELVKDKRRLPIMNEFSGTRHGEEKEKVPIPFAELIEWCWKPQPDERPTFREILDFIERNFQDAKIDHSLIPISTEEPRGTTKPVKAWDVDDVCRWLTEMKFEEYVAAFKAGKIDGETLLEMTSEELESLGLQKFHRKNLLIKIKRLHS